MCVNNLWGESNALECRNFMNSWMIGIGVEFGHDILLACPTWLVSRHMSDTAHLQVAGIGWPAAHGWLSLGLKMGLRLASAWMWTKPKGYYSCWSGLQNPHSL